MGASSRILGTTRLEEYLRQTPVGGNRTRIGLELLSACWARALDGAAPEAIGVAV